MYRIERVETLRCPFCKENIIEEARVCKSCRRDLRQDLWLIHQLSTKQLLDFVKKLQGLSSTKSLRVSSLTEAAKALEKTPLLLAWDLSPSEAQDFAQTLKDFPIHFHSKAESDRLAEELGALQKSWRVSVVGGLAIVSLLFLVAIFWPRLSLDNRTSEGTKPRLQNGPSEIVNFQVNTPVYQNDAASRPTPPAEVQDNRFANDRSLTRQDIERLLNATVFIRGPSNLGTGFLITSDGYILSNSHVTSKMESPTVILRDGRSFKARKVKEDPKIDLSLIRIDAAGLTYLEMGDANELYPGQQVLTIGNPSGLSFTVTGGLVSFLGRELNGIRYIQTDAAINPGNSGGPMITHDLKVVGVNTLTSAGQAGISFSLPINYAFESGGVAFGYGSAPREAPSFRGNQIDAMTASLGDSNSSGSIDLYSQELESLKVQISKKSQDAKSEYSALEQERKTLEAHKTKVKHDQFKADEIQREIDRTSLRMQSIQQNHWRDQINFLDRVISLLLRQKADSRFASVKHQIEAQIQDISAQKRELESQKP